MRSRIVLGIMLGLAAAGAGAVDLRVVYEQAGPAGDYDRYVVLEPGVTYTGGLWIGRTFDRIAAVFEGAGENVRIVGRGALLDLRGEEICIAYCNNRLDLDDCIILNGNVRFRGYEDDTTSWLPSGTVRHVTFYRPHDYGVRLFHAGPGVRIERNLIVDVIDTGPDFMYLSGAANGWLPTGAAVSQSLIGGPDIVENWTYQSDAEANADPLRHFSVLCDYG